MMFYTTSIHAIKLTFIGFTALFLSACGGSDPTPISASSSIRGSLSSSIESSNASVDASSSSLASSSSDASSSNLASTSSLSSSSSSSVSSNISIVSSVSSTATSISSASSISSEPPNSSLSSSAILSSSSSEISSSSSTPSSSSSAVSSTPISTGLSSPAVNRGGDYFGFAERFNRYYTDSEWQPLRKVHVSAGGVGTGLSINDPASVQGALAAAQPGDYIEFAAGTYNNACYELDGDHSGTYEQPIVLRGARNAAGKLTSVINCCNTGRRSCFNLEFTNYVAIDGFELVGGKYGVRAVASYDTAGHSQGNAFLSNYGHDNAADPFFTGSNDWFVIEGNKAERAGNEDGHGIYLSNGSDWNIARFNELNDNANSDFQINADPASTCADRGIAYTDPQCDGDARDGLGDGVSEYMMVDNNYFHNGRRQGANFTSVRNSLIRNNIFAFYERHGVSFWQETSNPALGSHSNTVHHNIFIGNNNRELLQFMRHSRGNNVSNNIMVGADMSTVPASTNASTLVLVASDTSDNTYTGNMYIGGRLVYINDSTDITGEAEPNATEFRRTEFDPDWFTNFPNNRLGTHENFYSAAGAPWLGLGSPFALSMKDRTGVTRTVPTDLGPFVSGLTPASVNIVLPPVNAGLDYQLGGAYSLPANIGIVARDREATPAVNAYNICYINGFQVQPGEEGNWDADLILRDEGGNPIIDADWNEMLLDVGEASKRIRIATVIGNWILQCKTDGFDAVEIDNLDTYSRSGGRLTQDNAVAFMQLLSTTAHTANMAIAQKNSSEIVNRATEMATDFAVTEECSAWNECGDYINHYGEHVLMIEYTNADFQKGCTDYGATHSIVHRDINLVPSGQGAYVFDGC